MMRTKRESGRRTGIITKRIRTKYLTITAASVIYALGVSLFLDPNALAPGGVTGVSVILNRFTPVETGAWVLILNLPILAVGAWKFGLRFLLSTIYCILVSSVTMQILEPFGAVTQDLFLAAVTGGGLMAVGVGLIFKAGATTGGMDIAVKLLRLRLPHLRPGTCFLIADSFVVALSALLFHNIELALYAGLTVLVHSFLVDVVLYGRDGAKLVYIISRHSPEITSRLLQELDVGATYLEGRGAFYGNPTQIVMCVMRKQLFPKAEEIIKEEDSKAFLIVTNASEIIGEGYHNIHAKVL